MLAGPGTGHNPIPRSGWPPSDGDGGRDLRAEGSPAGSLQIGHAPGGRIRDPQIPRPERP